MAKQGQKKKDSPDNSLLNTSKTPKDSKEEGKKTAKFSHQFIQGSLRDIVLMN
jgi:hypothetical protein